MVRFFECGLLKSDPDVKVAMMHMEEMRSTTYRAMATYELGINVRTKEDAAANGVSEDAVIGAAQRIADDRTVVFELRSHDDPMKILDYVRMAATVYGVDYVFIDHVQRLAYLSQGGADGATSLLTAVGSRMAQLAKELDIGVIFISQVNDDGRTKYAGSLEEEAIICIKLERDVESEDEDERNTTTFVVDKNRPFSRLGKAGSIYYDPDTTILAEGEGFDV
jgi:replicative DNA helicase